MKVTALRRAAAGRLPVVGRGLHHEHAGAGGHGAGGEAHHGRHHLRYVVETPSGVVVETGRPIDCLKTLLARRAGAVGVVCFRDSAPTAAPCRDSAGAEDGSLWYDNGGQAWLRPTSPQVLQRHRAGEGSAASWASRRSCWISSAIRKTRRASATSLRTERSADGLRPAAGGGAAGGRAVGDGAGHGA